MEEYLQPSGKKVKWLNEILKRIEEIRAYRPETPPLARTRKVNRWGESEEEEFYPEGVIVSKTITPEGNIFTDIEFSSGDRLKTYKTPNGDYDYKEITVRWLVVEIINRRGKIEIKIRVFHERRLEKLVEIFVSNYLELTGGIVVCYIRKTGEVIETKGGRKEIMGEIEMPTVTLANDPSTEIANLKIEIVTTIKTAREIANKLREKWGGKNSNIRSLLKTPLNQLKTLLNQEGVFFLLTSLPPLLPRFFLSD